MILRHFLYIKLSHIYSHHFRDAQLTGGSIPLSLSERLSAGITFAVGNTRAFAAVGQQGSVTTWGDPACGGNSGLVTEELKSKAFQLCYNEWVAWLRCCQDNQDMQSCRDVLDRPHLNTNWLRTKLY